MQDLSEVARLEELVRIRAVTADREEDALRRAFDHPSVSVRADALRARIGRIVLFDQAERDNRRAEEWFEQHSQEDEPPSFLSHRQIELIGRGFAMDYQRRFSGIIESG